MKIKNKTIKSTRKVINKPKVQHQCGLCGKEELPIPFSGSFKSKDLIFTRQDLVEEFDHLIARDIQFGFHFRFLYRMNNDRDIRSDMRVAHATPGPS